MLESLLANESIPEGRYFVIRCDVRRFGKLIKKAGYSGYKKDFHKKLVEVAKKTIENILFSGFAYVFSDEISFVLPPSFNLYSRRVEKIMSVVPAYASGEGSLLFYELDMSPIVFDAKIFICENMDKVLEYLLERKSLCFRNYVSFEYGEYRKRIGESGPVNGVSLREMTDILLKNGLDVYNQPYWKRLGTMVRFEYYKKHVHQGLFGPSVEVTRRRLVSVKPEFDIRVLSEWLDRGGINEE